jgi:xanthine phosphoribosyltransferase
MDPAATIAAMDLRSVIRDQGRIRGDLLMVDTFLNHRVDTAVMGGVGEELATRLASFAPDVILTAEASGIPPAMATAAHMRLPFVYAKKFVGDPRPNSIGQTVSSPTKGFEYRVEVAGHILDPGLRIAVVDDFLARGRTAQALGEIAEEAGGQVVATAFVIEKVSFGGHDLLARHGWPIFSLVRIGSLENDTIDFVD